MKGREDDAMGEEVAERAVEGEEVFKESERARQTRKGKTGSSDEGGICAMCAVSGVHGSVPHSVWNIQQAIDKDGACR
jgi:hypothetical protein